MSANVHNKSMMFISQKYTKRSNIVVAREITVTSGAVLTDQTKLEGICQSHKPDFFLFCNTGWFQYPNLPVCADTEVIGTAGQN